MKLTTSPTAYYEADGPLSHRDVAVLRKHHWISLRADPCRMWWQGGGFMLHGNGSDLRVPYDTERAGDAKCGLGGV